MKLEDIKHLIDAHFDSITPMELVTRLESLGYEFEPIEDSLFPYVADSSEISGNNRFKDTFQGQIELGVSYLERESPPQYADPTYYDSNRHYAIAA